MPQGRVDHPGDLREAPLVHQLAHRFTHTFGLHILVSREVIVPRDLRVGALGDFQFDRLDLGAPLARGSRRCAGSSRFGGRRLGGRRRAGLGNRFGGRLCGGCLGGGPLRGGHNRLSSGGCFGRRRILGRELEVVGHVEHSAAHSAHHSATHSAAHAAHHSATHSAAHSAHHSAAHSAAAHSAHHSTHSAAHATAAGADRDDQVGDRIGLGDELVVGHVLGRDQQHFILDDIGQIQAAQHQPQGRAQRDAAAACAIPASRC